MCQVDGKELFAPDDVGVDNGCYFGLPVDPGAGLVLLPVAWDVTVSYGAGTSSGPEAIREASLQVEIYDPHFPDSWKKGIGTAGEVVFAKENNAIYRAKACQVIEHLERGGATSDVADLLAEVNSASEKLNVEVYRAAKAALGMNQRVGLVGGDHSTPLGLLRALSEQHLNEGRTFGILHLDAHADLRDAYEGFTYSHASIMRNTLRDCGAVERLVQVGLRDYSEGERMFATEQGERVVWFENKILRERGYGGMSWRMQCEAIIGSLPERVYVSCDIDGLEPTYCPGTGTPVPGGLTFDEWVYLLKLLRDSGRQIVGFDLTEVSPREVSREGSLCEVSPREVAREVSLCEGDEWDANVGARVLYKLCGATLY